MVERDKETKGRWGIQECLGLPVGVLWGIVDSPGGEVNCSCYKLIGAAWQ